MSYGEKMAASRRRLKMSQEELGKKVMYSREAIAKYEINKRPVPTELIHRISQAIDEPEFYFETWTESTGHVSIPFFNGDNIDPHPASMLFLVQTETSEAVDQLKKVCWAKPASAYTLNEKEDLKKALFEVLDAAATMINLVAIICKHHRFSMKDIFLSWRISLKARKYNK